jgi:CBS domain-containing protein
MTGNNFSGSPASATKLEDVLVEKEATLRPEQSVQEAGDKMRRLQASALPVAEGRHLVGMVDQCDPDRRAAGFGHDPAAVVVSEIMNSNVAYCFEDEGCAEALRQMNTRNLDRLPVVDRQMRIVGIVNRADLTRPAAAKSSTASQPPQG